MSRVAPRAAHAEGQVQILLPSPTPVLNSYFCLFPRGARQAAAHGHLSRISRWTAQRVSIFLLGTIRNCHADTIVAADCENLGAYFTRNPASPSYLFPFLRPVSEPNQPLSRTASTLLKSFSPGASSAQPDTELVQKFIHGDQGDSYNALTRKQLVDISIASTLKEHCAKIRIRFKTFKKK